MITKHLVNPVTLTLELDDLTWLHTFLKEEIRAVEIDREKVNSLHTAMAIRAAKKTLELEHETMTKIAEAINKQIAVIDEHEALAKRIAAMTPPVA